MSWWHVAPRPHLMPLQQQALLTAAQIKSVRDHALFALALGAGFSAKALSRLDLGHVSHDGGTTIVSRFDVGRRDRRCRTANDNGAVVLSHYVRAALGRHAANIQSECPHFTKPMLSLVGRGGVALCASCGLVTDPNKQPLFSSRLRERLSARRMRSLFAEYRDQLRLPSHLHFDSLKATHDSGHLTDLHAA